MRGEGQGGGGERQKQDGQGRGLPQVPGGVRGEYGSEPRPAGGQHVGRRGDRGRPRGKERDGLGQGKRRGGGEGGCDRARDG